jgi:hypothetical protein
MMIMKKATARGQKERNSEKEEVYVYAENAKKRNGE